MQRYPQIAWFDLETTGLPPLKSVHIVEVAIVVVSGDDQRESTAFATLIKPPIRIPPGASKYSGIKDDHVTDALAFKAHAPVLYAMLHGKIWAGHNMRRYDAPLMHLEFERAGMEPPAAFSILDTLEVSRANFSRRPDIPDHKLETLAQYFGLLQHNDKQDHRAMSDVRLNMRVARRMFAQIYMEAALIKSVESVAQAKEPREPWYEAKEEPQAPQQQQLSVGRVQCQGKTQKGLQCRRWACSRGQGQVCSIHLNQLLHAKDD